MNRIPLLLYAFAGGAAEASSVLLQQPVEEEGTYSCRKVNKTSAELLDHDGGCWTMDKFKCHGSDGEEVLPFKDGSNCYVGRVTLPPDLCVDGFVLSGTWNHACDASVQDVQFSFCGDDTNKTINFWDPQTEGSFFWTQTHRACALRFYEKKVSSTPVVSSGGSYVTLQQPWPYRGSCHEMAIPEDTLLASPYTCWTMNEFACPKGGLPFKDGDDCYLGSVELPDDLCVEGFKLSGRWNLASPACAETAQPLFSFCGGGQHIFWDQDNRACALRFSKKPAPQGSMVLLEQPQEQQGDYTCRQVQKRESELLSLYNGCWSVDMFQCSPTQGLSATNLPFKWPNRGGSERSCYLGRITLPDDLCVELLPDEEETSLDCWSAKPFKRICGGGYHDFWDYNHRACELRFSKHVQKDHRMEVNASWKLLACHTAYRGHLMHEITVGIANESKFSEKFGERIKNSFMAGMEFNIGHLKNALTAEQKRLFENSWAVSSQRQTTDEVHCEMFGGTYCMWQWHMTFTEGSNSAYWDSPITHCARGTNTPGHAPRNSKSTLHEGGVPSSDMSTRFKGDSGLACTVVMICMTLAVFLVAGIRRVGIKWSLSALKEPLCTAPSL